ncbi:MAG TPA: TetR/AcrR family transcriptional regulator [Longimicrobiaceae bacterium]
MGIAERRERERTELRQKILDAARELFVEHGYESVSMRMIAKRIEYSPTAIYFHFKDKEALFQELCATDFLTLGKTFRKIATVEDPVERLRAAGRAYAQFAIDFPHHYRLMFMTPTPGPRLDPDDTRWVHRGNPEEDAYFFLKQTVEEGIRAGRFRPELDDPEELAQLVWAGVHGVVSLRIAKGNDTWIDWAPVMELVERVTEVTVRGITRTDA